MISIFQNSIKQFFFRKRFSFLEKLVSIIILNYNNYTLTVDCLNSLTKQIYSNFEIILVDNGSKISNYLELKKNLAKFKNSLNIKLTRNNRNLYFGGGSNKAIKIARGEYICLLNNDTIVMPDFIEKMVDFLENHPEAGMITPKIKFYKNKDYIWNAGASINYRKTIVVINRGYLEYDPHNEKYNDIETIGFAPGTALFIKKKVIEEIGLMDEIFLMYHEDPDWNFRAQQKGYKSYYVPTTIVYHNVPTIVDDRRILFNTFFFKRNSNILVWKYANLSDLIYFNMISFVAIMYEIILHLMNRKILFLFFPLYALYRGMLIGVKRRTNRSCRKNLIKDYYIVKRLQKF